MRLPKNKSSLFVIIGESFNLKEIRPMYRPKISIIIPVYNVEQYIVKCLDSVIAQTYKGDLECLLIDDCGHDNSVSLIEHYISNYSGDVDFRLLHHKQNRGLSAARNTGLMEATGEYVYYLDSDDWISENCIEIMAQCVSDDSLIQMVVGGIEVIPATKEKASFYDIKNKNLPDSYSDNASLRYKFYETKPTIPVNGVNKLLRRNFLIENNLFFKEGIIHEDEHWSFFLISKLDHVAIVKDNTYIHPINPNSIMTSSNKERSADNWAIILNDYLDNLDSAFMKQQYVYCLYKFSVWYPDYGRKDNFRKLYNRLLKLAIRRKYVKSIFDMCILKMKYILLSNSFIYNIIINRRNK